MSVKPSFDVEAITAELQQLLGDRLSTSQAVRDQHGQDESFHPCAAPDLVAFAHTTEDVAAIVSLCARHKTPIVAFGAGTSLEGHVNAIAGGVCIDLSQMDKVLQVRSEDMDVTVQAGVKRRQLEEYLRDTGLHFPVDPGADATLGGMAATGASGTTTLRYGAMRENVLALKVVMADGSIVELGGRARKSSAGYDLLHLIIGSEGTLGIITELTLRLYGRPEVEASGVCAFDSVQNMVDAVTLAIQCEIPLARMELMDELAIYAVNHYAGLDNEVAPTLFLEFHGTEISVAEDQRRFAEIADELGGKGFKAASSPEARKKLWQARHEALYAAKALNPGKKGLITDVCVPISQLAQSIADTRKDFDEHGIIAAAIGHVGDGNYHTTLWVEPGDDEALKTVIDASRRMVERAIAAGGTCTGEHGIGIGKRLFLQAEHPSAMAMMRTIKQALDPDNIMNPGKVI
ncbi:MAG: FAD-binding oxidoreductase [Robiginitomaculum sp.]|nr:MAG: FAD-binding oxidoreductase [Robiginitomaculum sp.]